MLYLADPARQQSVRNGWQVLKRQIHIQHTVEDDFIWPAVREHLARSEHAMSVLDAMEDEHQRVTPLVAAVDSAFDQRAVAPGSDARADHLAESWTCSSRRSAAISSTKSRMRCHSSEWA